MKKFVSTLALAALMLSANAGNWPGLQGSGSQDNPYLISTADDIFILANYISADNTGEGDYFLVTGNIDFNGSIDNVVSFPSIGKKGITGLTSVSWGFEGTFDGGNFTISGIYHTADQNNDEGKFNGLFASVGSKGIIKNVVIGENNYASSYWWTGYIASLCQGTIQNCINNAPLFLTNAYGAGICSYLIKGTGSVVDCVNKGDIYAMTYAAGIVGGTQSGAFISSSDSGYSSYVVENCTNYGKMSTKNGTGSGGIAGTFSGIVRNCTNFGEIDDASSSYSKGQYTAGVVSCPSYPAAIEGNVNNGNVKGIKYVGGIVGNIMKGTQEEFTIENNTNNGDISVYYVEGTAGNGEYVGGIIGYTLRDAGLISVADCHNSGNVTSSIETHNIGNITGYSGIVTADGNTVLETLPVLHNDTDNIIRVKDNVDDNNGDDNGDDKNGDEDDNNGENDNTDNTGSDNGNGNVNDGYTGLKEISGQTTTIEGKYLENGRIVIYRDGGKFDLSGRRVK